MRKIHTSTDLNAGKRESMNNDNSGWCSNHEPPTPLTDEERRSIRFLWEERGALENTTYWPKLRREYPELVDAWERYEAAWRDIDRLVQEI